MSGTNPVIGALFKDDVELDFYSIKAYLRDTCEPTVRPLYDILIKHMDDRLLAAVLIKHEFTDRRYELVLQHDNMIKRFSSNMARQAPSWNEFMREACNERFYNNPQRW